jgi:hypothetical protein
MQFLAADKVRLELLASQNQEKAQKLQAEVTEQKRRIGALESSLGIAENY